METSMMGKSEPFINTFVPEAWPAYERFRRFLGPPFAAKKDLSKAVNSVADHVRKFSVW